MRILLQRVSQASVTVSGSVVGSIGPGFLLFLGIKNTDTNADIEILVRKICNVRLFASETSPFDIGLLNDPSKELLVVSQFTLYGSTAKGRRPSFSEAMAPQQAKDLYEAFIQSLQTAASRSVATGIFGARMDVSLVNDGPATFILES